MRCFVAMAFGHEDTDAWFDQDLTPLLKRLGVLPRRVDRITHNDDIDDRIMFELRSADIVVADLTYARPSVYFEAGFAQRTVPVIYTARADHLDRHALDALRIHFDLSMKNVHTWTAPGDRAFADKFRKTFVKVSAPIRDEEGTEALLAHAAAQFGRFSVNEKVEYCRDELRGTVRDAKVVPLPRLGSSFLPVHAGSAFSGGRLTGVQYLFREALTKADLERLHQFGALSYPRYNLMPPAGEPKTGRVVDLTIIGVLRSVPLARARDALPNFRVVDPHTCHLRRETTEDWGLEHSDEFSAVLFADGGGCIGKTPRRGVVEIDLLPKGVQRGISSRPVERLATDPIPRQADLVVVEGVKSLVDLKTRASQAIEKWRSSLEYAT